MRMNLINFLATAIHRLTEALSVFKTGEFALMIDVAAYYHFLTCLKSTKTTQQKRCCWKWNTHSYSKLFKVVNKLIREEDEIRILADKAWEH